MYERVYSPSEASELLGIGDSTLRKWCLHLERAGYTFMLDARGHRSFTERDLNALRVMQECLSKRMTYEDAIQTVLSTPELPSEASLNRSDTSGAGSTEQLLLSLSGTVERLVECNEALVERLDAQQKATNELALQLERRSDERDRMLMQTLRLMQENSARREIAASVEPPQDKPKRKWFWGRKSR